MSSFAGAQRAQVTSGLPPCAISASQPSRAPQLPRPRQRACIHAAAAQSQPREPQAPAASSRASLLRRVALLSAAAATANGLQLTVTQQLAAAVLPPLGPPRGSADGPHSALELADPQLLPLPPGPVSFPRRQLGLNFAVLQLRSGYEAVADLDFVPTDEYQKNFWKFRQAEWEPYLLLLSPIRPQQGDLTSPWYFDFIAFCQASSAGAAMRNGKQVFEEFNEETEQVQVVTRDPSLADNALLPVRFFEREGDLIYRGLVDGFRGTQYGGPPPCAPGAPTSELLAGVQRILDIYVEEGYCLKATLTPGGGTGGATVGTGGGATFTVKLDGPANLWSLQALAARRSNLYNQHDAAAVAAFLRASGRSATCRLGWSDTAVVQQWSVA